MAIPARCAREKAKSNQAQRNGSVAHVKITVIGSARHGGRAKFFVKALRELDQTVQLVDSDTIDDRLRGLDYLAFVNRGWQLPLSRIEECKDADVILVIHHARSYVNDTKALVAFWHCEPYFSPSITPDLLLAADTNVSGHWLQWWRRDFAQVTRTVLFPFACPDLSDVLAKREVIRSNGFNMLANLQFESKDSNQSSYFERHALRKRQHVARDLGSWIIEHKYPMDWEDYIRELAECARVLIVPGGGCQFNQQFSECMSLGIMPDVYIEEHQQMAGYEKIGLRAGLHFSVLDDLLIEAIHDGCGPARGKWDPDTILKFAKANSYRVRALEFLKEIEITERMKTENERFAEAIK